MLNIRALLGDLGVPYWTTGKNVTPGWTSVSCPACGDRSNHGAFSPAGTSYSCFRCGSHKLRNIIAYYTDQATVTHLLKNYSDALFIPEKFSVSHASKVEWPPESAVEMPSVHAEYLHLRGYDPKQIRDMYKVECCYQTGNFNYRIIIPIIQDNKVVSYVGRDVTGKAKLKYKNLSDSKSVVSVKNTVYNLDAIHDTAIICEGIFDAWRFGSYGVAVYGLQFTGAQTRALAGRLRRAFIAFDAEPIAQQKALEMAEILALQGVSVEVVSLDVKDPGEMTQKEADQLRKELLKELPLIQKN